MGMFIHHAIVVTGLANEADIVTAHRAALETFRFPMVTPVQVAPEQGRASFAILPDGAKDSHSGSFAGDTERDAFFARIKGLDLDFVEVRFGETVDVRVERHSGQDEYVDAMIATPPSSRP